MSEEYPEKLAEYIDKLDFNNMDFAEEMKGIWDLAQKEAYFGVVERLSLARGHYVAPLKKESFLKHIDKLIKEYGEMST